MTEQVKSPTDGMTPDMIKVYTDFMGNPNLKKEWQLCNLQYTQATSILQANVPFAARMEYKKICDYWKSRRTALEKVIDVNTLSA